jgi:hypothetical protein
MCQGFFAFWAAAGLALRFGQDDKPMEEMATSVLCRLG